jgi:hypothetical protein
MLSFLKDTPSTVTGKDYRPINPSDIPTGENNKMAEEVVVEFAMTG